MLDINALVSVSCFILFMTGVLFIYYLSKTSQYNEASELRAKRRIEDVAYYLSKMEEQIEDSESQLQKKIDVQELDTRINLSIYENLVTRALPQKLSARKRKVREDDD
ncbi:MAG: hypothetical protein ABIF01_02285 [Candidatus Micrarchaeota archaeon]